MTEARRENSTRELLRYLRESATQPANHKFLSSSGNCTASEWAFFTTCKVDKSLGFYQKALEAARKIDDAKSRSTCIGRHRGRAQASRAISHKSAESNSHYDTAQEFYQKLSPYVNKWAIRSEQRSSETHLEKVWVLRGQPGRVITLREKKTRNGTEDGRCKARSRGTGKVSGQHTKNKPI